MVFVGALCCFVVPVVDSPLFFVVVPCCSVVVLWISLPFVVERTVLRILFWIQTGGFQVSVVVIIKVQPTKLEGFLLVCQDLIKILSHSGISILEFRMNVTKLTNT